MEFVLNLYHVLVEQMFGSVLVALLAVGVMLLIIMGICRTGISFVFVWLSFYFIVMVALYLGAIGLVLGFILSFTYFGIALMRYLMGI